MCAAGYFWRFSWNQPDFGVVAMHQLIMRQTWRPRFALSAQNAVCDVLSGWRRMLFMMSWLADAECYLWYFDWPTQNVDCKVLIGLRKMFCFFVVVFLLADANFSLRCFDWLTPNVTCDVWIDWLGMLFFLMFNWLTQKVICDLLIGWRRILVCDDFIGWHRILLWCFDWLN